ncbi:MAG: beta-lactamase family protein [Asticcacaulis sp.]|nr:beta-lactamase family protein [Asticcacaulis sp.]
MLIATLLAASRDGEARPAGKAKLYADIEDAIRAAAETTPGRSVSVGIVEDGRLVADRHYGSTTIGKTVVPDSATIYPIASITKVLTGIMFLQLVDRGVVHLTDRVEAYVPEFSGIPSSYPWTPGVTLMQLATMTSGIDVDDTYPAPPTGETLPWDDGLPERWDERLAANMKHHRFKFEPGTRRAYSNSSYAILGLALSRAAGRAYDDYVEREILKPLAMNDTSFAITEAASKRFAYGSETVAHLPSWKKSPMLPAGGAFSTMEDLVRLMRFQLGFGPETVLTNAALDDSFRLVVPSDGNLQYGDAIGFAAVRNADSDLVSIGHGGRTWFFSGSYQFDRSSNAGIIVLTTHWNDEFKPVVRRSLKQMHPSSHGGTGLEPLEHH